MLVSGDGDTELSSANWVNSINRGGLIRVNDMTFERFLSTGLQLRSHLKINTTHLGDEVVVQITESEDVLFLWSIISASWDVNHCSTALLKKIAKMWTTHSSWFLLCQCMGRKDKGCPAKNYTKI